MTDVEQPGSYHTAVSTDGTRLAYDQFGTGLPLIPVHGAGAHSGLRRPTAEACGRHCRAIAYDRRGRFDSGDTLPYAVEREIEDIAALIAAVGGGPVHLYGHSSGAGLALRAVAAGLPVTGLVLHDPPYAPSGDPAAQDEARDWARVLADLLGRGEPAEAVAEFIRRVGAPEEIAQHVKRSPEMVALAPTLAYDSAVMDDRNGGVLPGDPARRVS